MSESYLENEDYTESYDDAESYLGDTFDDASRDERRRRTDRRRRLETARQRQRARSQALARTDSATPPTPRQTVAAIRTLEVDHQIQDDNIRRAMSLLSKRQVRGEYAAVGTALVAQLIESFHVLPDNPVARALLRVAPQGLTLKAPTPGTGAIDYLARNPVIPGVVAAGVLAFTGARTRARTVALVLPPSVAAGTGFQLVARAVDAHGRTVPGVVVTWTASRGTITNGDTLTVPEPGPVLVTASVDGVETSTYVTVTGSSTQQTSWED